MNLKQLSLLIIAITTVSTLVHAKAFENPFRKNNQFYITFQRAGYFYSQDPDEILFGNSFLYMLKRAYPTAEVDKNTLVYTAVVVDGKNRLVENFCYLIPYNVVKNLKNGDKVLVHIGGKPINAKVK